MTDHVGAVTCMVWANGNGTSNEHDTFFTSGRDMVVNTWVIEEVERDQNLQSKKKQKKNNHSNNYFPLFNTSH